MGYTFTCDSCDGRYDHTPPFMGEFRESFLKTTPMAFAELYAPGETVTLCEPCCEGLLL
jgi:hypothetical protein